MIEVYDNTRQNVPIYWTYNKKKYNYIISEKFQLSVYFMKCKHVCIWLRHAKSDQIDQNSADSAGASRILIHVWLSLFDRSWLLNQLLLMRVLKNYCRLAIKTLISEFRQRSPNVRMECLSGGDSFIHLHRLSIGRRVPHSPLSAHDYLEATQSFWVCCSPDRWHVGISWQMCRLVSMFISGKLKLR